MQPDTNPQTRKPCGHSVTTHRHGLADTERVLAGSQDKGQLRHFRHCARTEGKREKMAGLEREHRKLASISPPGSAYLAGLRACESGGDYQAVDPSGTYRGAYQFDYGTWASVGGAGDPAAASPPEQDYRAAVLWRSRGSAPWPVCG